MTTLCLQDFTMKPLDDETKQTVRSHIIGLTRDYETARRREWLNEPPPVSYSGYPPELEIKRQAALEWLGTRWLLHPRSSLNWKHP